MKIIVIGDKQTVLMFTIAGIEGKIVENQEQAIEEIKNISKNKNYGLLIVTEEILSWATDLINQIRFTREIPLIIDIPGFNGPVEGVKNLADYIKEVIGVKI